MIAREFVRMIKSDLKHYRLVGFVSIISGLIFNLEFRLLLNYRICNFLYVSKSFFYWIIPFLIKKQRIRYGSHIHYSAKIGENFRFAHANGIDIGDAQIGNNVTIFHHVTLGSHGRKNEKMSYPIIEDNVKIYTGSVIIGGITVGHNSVIGANVVLSESVPPYSFVVTSVNKIITNKNIVKLV